MPAYPYYWACLCTCTLNLDLIIFSKGILPFPHTWLSNQCTLVPSQTKNNQASLRWTAQWSQTLCQCLENLKNCPQKSFKIFSTHISFRQQKTLLTTKNVMLNTTKYIPMYYFFTYCNISYQSLPSHLSAHHQHDWLHLNNCHNIWQNLFVSLWRQKHNSRCS